MELLAVKIHRETNPNEITTSRFFNLDWLEVLSDSTNEPLFSDQEIFYAIYEGDYRSFHEWGKCATPSWTGALLDKVERKLKLLNGIIKTRTHHPTNTIARA